MHRHILGDRSGFGAAGFASNLHQSRLRAVVVGIAAAGGVDPADAGQIKNLPHPVEQIVLEVFKRAVWVGMAFLGQQRRRRGGAGAQGQCGGHVLGEGLEFRAPRHRGAFALEFDHGADALGRIGVDREPAGRGFPIGTHRLRFHTLLAQPLHRLFGVAAALEQGLLALHHRQAGLVSQCHHRSGCDLCHRASPCRLQNENDRIRSDENGDTPHWLKRAEATAGLARRCRQATSLTPPNGAQRRL